jgi:hypothetical protein
MFVESDHKITDISDSLRKRGHYIPTQEDIDAYIHGETFVDRVIGLENMNKKNAKSNVSKETRSAWNKRSETDVLERTETD